MVAKMASAAPMIIRLRAAARCTACSRAAALRLLEASENPHPHTRLLSGLTRPPLAQVFMRTPVQLQVGSQYWATSPRQMSSQPMSQQKLSCAQTAVAQGSQSRVSGSPVSHMSWAQVESNGAIQLVNVPGAVAVQLRTGTGKLSQLL